MSLVIGKNQIFYNVPEDILKKYALSEEEVEKVKEKVKKTEITGEGPLDSNLCYEGNGLYCNWFDAAGE